MKKHGKRHKTVRTDPHRLHVQRRMPETRVSHLPNARRAGLRPAGVFGDLFNHNFTRSQNERLETQDLRRFRPRPRNLAVPGSPVLLDNSGAVALWSRHNTGALQRLQNTLHAYFQRPDSAIICTRRHDRRSVLFALRKIGRGKGGSRSPRWTENSFIQCRRVN